MRGFHARPASPAPYMDPKMPALLPMATSPNLVLARSSAAAVGIRVAGAAFGLLFNIVLAHALGREGTGAILFYLNFASMIGLIATGGMDVVGLRELSRHASASQQLFGQIFLNAFLSAALFAAGAFAFLMVFGASLAGVSGTTICALAAAILFLTAFQKAFSDWLIALGEYSASQISFYFINRVVATVLLVASVVLARSPDAETCIVVYALGLLLAVSFAAWRFSACLSTKEIIGVLSPSVALLRDGIACGMQNAAFIALSLSPFVLLGALSNTSEVALFGISQRLAAIMILAVTAVSQFVMRDFAVASDRQDFEAIAHSLTLSVRLTWSIAVAITIVLVVFSHFWVSLFGRPFAGAAATLALLSAAICTQCLGMPFQSVLLASNHERAAKNVTIASTAIGIAANLLLIPRWGAEGAAVGTGIGLALQSLGHGLCVLFMLPLWINFTYLRAIPVRGLPS